MCVLRRLREWKRTWGNLGILREMRARRLKKK